MTSKPGPTTLEVHFTDESVREYALEIGLMIYAPEMWVLGVLVMLFSVMLLALVISYLSPTQRFYAVQAPC